MSEPTPLEAIFFAALEKPAAERGSYLAEACGSDADLRRRVERMLAAQVDAASFLETPPSAIVREASPTIDSAPLEKPGTQIGPYKLLQQIGEGGMGVVYMAEQHEPVKRRVALKIIKPGMDTRQVIARFEAERQALSLMDHPNIAKVLDAGTTDSGRPYFVMELVKGQPITQYCDEKHLTPRQRLELLLPVCQAIQHAHQKGIIHRDIKPTNILVAEYDQQPVPKVIDFGVAKATSQTLTEKTMFTGLGQIVGTLEYMSPEQAKVNQLDIDTRSDIYSLGVLLYELLTGSTPFDRQRLRSAAFDEMLRIIREEEPPKPSTRLSDSKDSLPSVSAQRQTEPAKLTKLVRGELDWIVMKALEKDRNRRYETANGFAMDVQRYLNDEPVQACPPSAAYRLRKFARRNKAALGMASIIAVALLLVVGSVGWVVRDRTAREQELARARAARQAKLNQEVELALREASTLRERALTLTDNPHHWDATQAVAAAALRRAEGLAAQDEAALEPQARDRLNELRSTLDADQNDRRFVARFDEIHLEQTRLDVAHSRFMEETAFDAVRHALKTAYGIEIGTTPAEEVAAIIRRRPKVVQEFLMAALDLAIIHAPRPGTRGWLIAASDAADTDQWRKEARRAVAARDEPAIEKLARDALAARRPVSLLRWLASGLPETGEVRLKLFREIQQAHPGDFWANHDLAIVLQFRSPPLYEEAIRFHTAAIAVRPRDPASYVNLGGALRGKGDLDAGVAAFRRAIDLSPNYPAAYRALGSALRAKGDRDGAEAVYQKSIDVAPDRVLALFQLGMTRQLDDCDVPGCIATYREVIRLNPTFAVAYYNLGVAYSAQKKLPDAVAAYKKAIEIDPNYAGARYSLGRALQSQGKLEEAVAAYGKAIELVPSSAKVHNSLGNVFHEQGKFEAALDCYRKAIELDPKDAVPHLNIGNVFHDQGKLDDAVAWYRKSTALDPNYALAYSNLGLALRDQRKLEDAVAACRKAIELNPNLAIAHNNLGWALQAQGKLEDAVAAYRKALELDPKLAKAQINLGNALQFQGKPEEVIRHYRKVIELEPNSKLHADPYFRIGKALETQGKLGEAIACFEKAAELDPKWGEAHDVLAWLLMICPDVKLRNDRRALEVARKAVELAPQSSLSWQMLGWAHYRAGDWKASIAALEKSCALQNDPKGGDAFQWFFLAMAHWQLGEKDQARQSYDRAVAWMDSHAPNDGNLRSFREEAAELLGLNENK